MEEVFLLVLVICCFVTGHISKQGSRSYLLGFINSFFLAAVGIFIVVAISMFSGFDKPTNESAILGGYIGLVLSVVLAYSTREIAKCSQCAEEIKPEAKICKHCGHSVNT
jgi:Na+(H+)/acetate symporter ActP